MVLIKSKKAGAEYLVEFVFAVVILVIVIMVIRVAIAYDIGTSLNIDATVDEYSASAVCDTDLLNFLRFKDKETGLTFAELAVLAEKDFTYTKKFSERATDFFNNNYKRGREGAQLWELELVTMEKLFIAKAGEVRAPDPSDTCSQNIPSKTPGRFVVLTLKLEY